MQRVPTLDGIRGIAVLLVLGAHLGMIAGYQALWMGALGVDIFFVLSGFLITRILLRDSDLVQFYKRRALRIWPLYYGFILAATLCFGWHGWSYLFLCQNIVPHPESVFSNVVAQTWSLCVEEHFYLVWPFVVRFMPRHLIPLVLIPCILSGLFPWQTSATWLHLAPIATGCWMGFITFERSFWSWLEHRFLTFTGRISYGLYLFHYPVFIALQSHAVAREPVWIRCLVAVALSYGLAELSWEYFEKRILHWRGMRIA